MKCPLCNGSGKIKENLTTDKVKELRKRRLTIRQIAKVLKKGTTTVFYHLKKNKMEVSQ